MKHMKPTRFQQMLYIGHIGEEALFRSFQHESHRSRKSLERQAGKFLMGQVHLEVWHIFLIDLHIIPDNLQIFHLPGTPIGDVRTNRPGRCKALAFTDTKAPSPRRWLILGMSSGWKMTTRPFLFPFVFLHRHPRKWHG